MTNFKVKSRPVLLVFYIWFFYRLDPDPDISSQGSNSDPYLVSKIGPGFSRGLDPDPGNLSPDPQPLAYIRNAWNEKKSLASK